MEYATDGTSTTYRKGLLGLPITPRKAIRFERTRAQGEAAGWAPWSISFWRCMGVSFCVFSIVGHWMEIPYCLFNKHFFGIVEADSLVFADPMYPFLVYGIAAVLGALERAYRRRDYRISIRSRGRYRVSYESRIVAAAVFSVEHEHKIQDPCLKLGELAVRSYHVKNILSGIVFGNGRMDIKIPVLDIMSSCHVSVRDEHRESCDELRALSYDIGYLRGIRIVIIGIES